MTSSDKRGPRQVPPPQGGPARPAGGYSRFIPREELSGFASWTPDAFAGQGDDFLANPAAVARAAAAQRLAAAAAAAAPVEPPPPAAPTEDEWLAQVQDSRQSGYQDGYRDGLEALEAAKRQHLQQVSAQMAALTAAFDEQMAALEARIADAVVSTALTLARQVVRSELTQRPELVNQVAQEAVGAVMLSARHLRLRLNPADLPLIEAGSGDALRAREVIIQGDAGVARGGCMVESDLGRVDARIDSRWAQAVAVFGSTLPLASDPELAEAGEGA